MVKKIFTAFCVFVLFAGIGFWYYFIREEIVNDKNSLMLCLSKDQITFENAQSAKFIADINTSILHDTLKLEIKTTSVSNPFASFNNQYGFYHFAIKPNLRYVMIGDEVTALNDVKKCMTPQVK